MKDSFIVIAYGTKSVKVRHVSTCGPIAGKHAATKCNLDHGAAGEVRGAHEKGETQATPARREAHTF